MTDNKIKTIEGVAENSKAGIVVDGVLLMNLSFEEEEKYSGRNIRVTGEIVYDHPWKADEKDSIQKQGFTMPAMIKVISIEMAD